MILLTGIGGSGRQSAARLAAFMSDFELFQIEITKNYTSLEWREDLRKMIRRAGVEGVSTVFLFGDHQIKVWLCRIKNKGQSLTDIFTCSV